MSVRISIHQPEFAPWLGFFDKVSRADRLVLLDDVQYRKNYFHNRNRVRTLQGWSWITVPVARTGLATLINEAVIADERDAGWRERIERTVEQAYSKALYFQPQMDRFCSCLAAAGTRLASLNVPILQWMLEGYGLAPDVIMSSELRVNGSGSQRILEICQKTGASTYVSGISGRDYLDLDSFAAAGIAVEFQDYHHPIYRQLHETFEPLMSAIEPLFLLGDDAPSLLSADWPQRMDQVFT